LPFYFYIFVHTIKLGNDEAREGDSTDDMTDMMTKKGKGSNDTLNREEGSISGICHFISTFLFTPSS
jgi:nitric oxide reductase activation protein